MRKSNTLLLALVFTLIGQWTFAESESPLQEVVNKYNLALSPESFVKQYYSQDPQAQKYVLETLKTAKVKSLPKASLNNYELSFANVSLNLNVSNLENGDFSLNDYLFNLDQDVNKFKSSIERIKYFERVLRHKKISYLDIILPIAWADDGLVYLAPIADSLTQEMSRLSYAKKIAVLSSRLTEVGDRGQVSIEISCQKGKSPSKMGALTSACSESIFGGPGSVQAAGFAHKLSFKYQGANGKESEDTYYVLRAGHLLHSSPTSPNSRVVHMINPKHDTLEASCTAGSPMEVLTGTHAKLSSQSFYGVKKDKFVDAVGPDFATEIYKAVTACCEQADDLWGSCQSKLKDEAHIKNNRQRSVKVQSGAGAR